MSPLDQRALMSAKDTLRLYGALLPAQREALSRGLPLAAAPMTPAQRALLRAALQRDDSREVVLSDDDLASVRFSLTAQPKVMVVQSRPEGTAYQVGEIPARGGTSVAAPIPAVPAAASPMAAPKPDAVRRYSVLQLTFHYQVGAQRFDLPPLTVGAPART